MPVIAVLYMQLSNHGKQVAHAKSRRFFTGLGKCGASGALKLMVADSQIWAPMRFEAEVPLISVINKSLKLPLPINCAFAYRNTSDFTGYRIYPSILQVSMNH